MEFGRTWYIILGHSRKGIRAAMVHNLIEWGRYSNIILGFRLGMSAGNLLVVIRIAHESNLL